LIASLPQVHSQSEQRLTFATHPTRIRYRINSPETGFFAKDKKKKSSHNKSSATARA
jgi:hypothetical protein